MIKLFILGFPHTATTYCYKFVKSKLPNLLGVFEPFNAEVVSWCVSSDRVLHYSEGAVEHDFSKLPKDVRDLVIKNASWFDEWCRSDEPRQRFLGNNYMTVLSKLDQLPQAILIKDVCAWVELPYIVHTFSKSKFILLLKDYESVEADFLKLYDIYKARGEIDKLRMRWLMGIGLFYRFFTGKKLGDRVGTKEDVRELLSVTYSFYRVLVRCCRYVSNVAVIEFEKRLTDDKIIQALKQLGLLR